MKKTALLIVCCLSMCLLSMIVLNWSSVPPVRPSVMPPVREESTFTRWIEAGRESFTQQLLPRVDKAIKRAILIIADDRCEYLEMVLDSLSVKPDLSLYDVYLSYFGDDLAPCITNLLSRFPKLVRRVFQKRTEGINVDNRFTRIANNYINGLRGIFIEGGYDFCIVHENDIPFEGDALSYYRQMEGVLDSDPSVSFINGLNRHSLKNNSFSPYRFYRMNEFVPWGIMMSRVKYLEFKDYLRETEEISWVYTLYGFVSMNDYDSIYPELCRSRHIGKKGVTVNNDLNTRLENLALSELPSGSPLTDLTYLMRENYRSIMEPIISRTPTTHVGSGSWRQKQNKTLNYLFTRTGARYPAKALEFFGINPIFGPHYDGTVMVHNQYQVPFFVTDCTISPVCSPTEGVRWKIAPNNKLQRREYQAIASELAENCHAACMKVSRRCDSTLFRLMNNCTLMRSVFGCKFCAMHYNSSAGFVEKDPGGAHEGFCVLYLETYVQSNCGLKVDHHRRLCPCR